ncbi:hypothetical protein PG988_011109 [Apiospora saccharicola]
MSTPSTGNQAQGPLVVGFANSITETLEGTSWWTNNEGGVATKDTFITGIRLYGDQEGIDYVREGLVITRLASLESNTAETFKSRVDMARATALQRRPVGVTVRPDHPDLEEMGIDMEGEEFAILDQFLITDFWMMWKSNQSNAISVPSQFDPENRVCLVIPKDPAIVSPVGSKAKFSKLWAGVQDGSIPLKRCPVTEKIFGQLTRFLATNYGVDYNAKMRTQTTPFSEAPEIIRELRDDLTSLVADITGEKPEFNEGLAIGNYPDMSMGWHSDGERGVGPIVASFSYGGTALMKFDIKNKFKFGRGGPGNAYEYETILPGCVDEHPKRVLQRKRDSGRITEEKYREEFRTIVNSAKKTPEPKPILEMPLPGTGAVMIQVGPSLNTRYNHMVEHQGIARLVFTCRSIQHEEKKHDERPAKRQKTSKK